MGEQLPLSLDSPPARRLSVTALVELRRCPRRFAFHEVEGHPRRAPTGGPQGAATHRAIEIGLRQGGPLPAGAGPYRDRRLIAAELPIRLRRRGRLLTGRIDAVFAGPGDDDWELVDWKSGGPPAVPDPADDTQLEVYALAAIDGYGRPAGSLTTTYVHLATGETRARRWNQELAVRAEGHLDADLRRIETGDLPAVANRGCAGCPALPGCSTGLASLV